MEYRKLGHSDLTVSRIGFGCWAIGGHGYGAVSDRESINAIQSAFDFGITFFDTADVYGFGHSEEVLSRALGSKRKEVIIATKCGVSWDQTGRTYKDCSPSRIVEALDESLRRLRVDCIPLYQIHWHDDRTPVSEVMEILNKCRQAGKIRYIGCCNFPYSLLIEALNVAKIESLQLMYNLSVCRQNEVIQTVGKLRLGIIVYNVLARGLFSGKYGPDSVFEENDTRGREPDFSRSKIGSKLRLVKALTEIGSYYGKSSLQVAIRWVLENPHVTCALIGIKSVRQLTENLGALNWELKVKDKKYLENFAEIRGVD